MSDFRNPSNSAPLRHSHEILVDGKPHWVNHRHVVNLDGDWRHTHEMSTRGRIRTTTIALVIAKGEAKGKA